MPPNGALNNSIIKMLQLINRRKFMRKSKKKKKPVSQERLKTAFEF